METVHILKIQEELARSRMESLVNRKIHAGFGSAVEGVAPTGNRWQAPHPTGIIIVISKYHATT